jgi:hypothetical protein
VWKVRRWSVGHPCWRAVSRQIEGLNRCFDVSVGSGGPLGPSQVPRRLKGSGQIGRRHGSGQRGAPFLTPLPKRDVQGRVGKGLSVGRCTLPARRCERRPQSHLPCTLDRSSIRCGGDHWELGAPATLTDDRPPSSQSSQRSQRSQRSRIGKYWCAPAQKQVCKRGAVWPRDEAVKLAARISLLSHREPFTGRVG